MLQTLTASPTHVIFTVAIGLITMFAIVSLLKNLFSIKPIDLSAQEKGHRGYDEAQANLESLELQLAVLEDLDGDPLSLNQLSERVAVAEMARDAEEVNMKHQRQLQEASREAEKHPGVVAPQGKKTSPLLR